MKIGLIAGVFVAVAGISFSWIDIQQTPEQAIRQRVIAQTDSVSICIQKMQAAVINRPANQLQLKRLFLQVRLSYKKIEWAAEYFAPNITRFVNGPPVPEVELSGQVFDPEGLQVIEGILFPAYKSSHKKELIQRLDKLSANVDNYRAHFKKIDFYNWQIIDAAKQQVFRVETLGITGFDDPLSLNCMAESAASLSSLQNVLTNYTPVLKTNFGAAVHYLQQNPGFNTFNRALFITRYADPLTIAITGFQQKSNFPIVKYNRLLNQDAATLFEKGAFNSNAFIDEPAYAATPEKIALGKKLFSDPILSGTLNRSCASCHKPENAFTDGLAKSLDIGGKNTINRNAPTLINAALQPAQFYDLRAGTLEDQAIDVIQNKMEMHGDMQLSTKKLWHDQTYRALFTRAFPQRNRTGIDTLEVMNAIGSYIRSLTALNSRFDEYMQGNTEAINQVELKGFNLFMGKARCATCHYMPLFNGTVPPKFSKMDAEVIGVPLSKKSKLIDPDMGRYTLVPIPSLKHAFKTTTIRNAAKTAPYMHNGVFNTLTEVLNFYNKGGGAGEGLSVSNQTLAATPLHLTVNEQECIVAFIKSLDSR